MRIYCHESLSAGEILDAFPDECKTIFPIEFKRIEKEVRVWQGYYRQVINGPYDLVTQQFLIGVLDMVKPKNLFRHYQGAKRLSALMQPEDGEISYEKIQEARSVPIKLLVPVMIPLETSYRIKAKCMIHDEKTPSFIIYKKTNTWFCFGCSKGGDNIELVMQVYRFNFKQAVEYILRNR